MSAMNASKVAHGVAAWQVVKWANFGQSHYASLLGPPHHQLRAVSNSLPRTHFTTIHRMALVRSRMDRRVYNAPRAIQVSPFPCLLDFAMTCPAVY